MKPVLSREQMSAFDRHAIERCKVPGALLMENAGRGAAHVIWRELRARERVLVLCGSGNNGGDGYVVARHLLAAGLDVCVFSFVPSEQLAGDARLNFDAWIGVGGELTFCLDDADLARLDQELAGSGAIVDALFGTGLTREVTGRLRAVIERVNATKKPVFALDIPSGLNADTGESLGAAIVASRTITFGHYKLGLFSTRATAHTGELELAGLGVPGDIEPAQAPRAQLIEERDAAEWLTPRLRAAHKGSAGRVLVLAGSPGKTGAALLASQAALRAGAGLVTVCNFPEVVASLEPRVVEVMTESLDPDRIEASLDRLLERTDALVIGPGLGLDARARALSAYALSRFAGPKVIDADALTHFAGRAQELRHMAGQAVLTPHPAELGRLFGMSAAEVEADRFGAVRRTADATGQVVLLKGPYTLIAAPGFPIWINTSGRAVLATGGSGDVLAGIIGGLAAGLPLPAAVALGAYLHGKASQLWVESQAGADRGLLARELTDLLPPAFAALSGVRARLSE